MTEYGIRVGERHTSTVVDTPDAIDHYRLLVMKGRLKIETHTGLKFRVSTLKGVNKELGTNYHSKKKALEHLERYIDEKYGNPMEDPL